MGRPLAGPPSWIARRWPMALPAGACLAVTRWLPDRITAQSLCRPCGRPPLACRPQPISPGPLTRRPGHRMARARAPNRQLVERADRHMTAPASSSRLPLIRPSAPMCLPPADLTGSRRPRPPALVALADRRASPARPGRPVSPARRLPAGPVSLLGRSRAPTSMARAHMPARGRGIAPASRSTSALIRPFTSIRLRPGDRATGRSLRQEPCRVRPSYRGSAAPWTAAQLASGARPRPLGRCRARQARRAPPEPASRVRTRPCRTGITFPGASAWQASASLVSGKPQVASPTCRVPSHPARPGRPSSRDPHQVTALCARPPRDRRTRPSPPL